MGRRTVVVSGVAGALVLALVGVWWAGNSILTDADEGEVTAASTSTSTSTSSTSTTSSTSVDRATLIDIDDVLAFYELFVTAIRTDDAETLIDRLHPVVLDIYGEEQCREFVEPRYNNPAFDFEVVAVGPLETWEWAPEGGTPVPVPEAVTVEARQTNEPDEDPFEVTVHVALDGDEVAWFTDCGEAI